MPRALTKIAPPPTKKWLAIIATLCLAIIAPFASATQASAAEIPNAITSIDATSHEVIGGENTTLKATWAVPDGSKPGDTFTLDLPSSLQALTSSFALRNAAGNVIANAVVENGNIVVTLANYVAANPTNIRGTLQFDVRVDQNAPIDVPITVTWSGHSTTITPIANPYTGRVTEPSKFWWGPTGDNGEYAGATIQVPGKSDDTVITDSLKGGKIQCDKIELYLGDQTNGYPNPMTPISSGYTVDSCDSDGFTITVTRALGDNDLLEVRYLAIADEGAKRMDNSYTVTSTTWNRSGGAFYTVPSAGGDGDSEASKYVSVGDYVFEDTNKDGLQDDTDVPLEGVELTLTGPDGKTVTDVDGNPVGPTKTDENGKYSFDRLPVLEAGQHYTVTVTTPEGYEPTVANAGDDRSKDSSTGSAQSEGLTEDRDRDSTLDFGFVKVATPNPTETATDEPTDEPTTDEPTDEPTTDEPSDEPTTTEPTTDEPTTDEPTTDAPSDEPSVEPTETSSDEPSDEPTVPVTEPSDDTGETSPSSDDTTNTSTPPRDNDNTGGDDTTGTDGDNTDNTGGDNTDTSTSQAPHDNNEDKPGSNDSNGTSVHSGGHGVNETNQGVVWGGIALIALLLAGSAALYARNKRGNK